MLIHRESLELANLALDPDDAPNSALSGIEIKPDGHVGVCDGHMWLRVSGKVEEPSLFDALIPVEEREHKSTIVLPAEAAKSFNAAMKKRKVKKDAPAVHVVISQEETAIRIASSDGKVTRRFEVEPLPLEYPDLDAVFKNHATAKTVIFGLDVLMPLLKTLRACGAQSVEFQFPEQELAPVKVRAQSINVGVIEGAVMPMKPGSAPE